MSEAKSPFFYAMLFFTIFLAVTNYTIDIMASLYIVSDLGGSDSITNYAVTFFALGNALGIPLGRGLLEKIGAVRFLIASLLLFTFFSWACGVAPTYPFFIAMRFLQGYVAGPFYVLTFYLISCLVPEKNRGLFTVIFMSLLMMSPVIGACIGGWIAYDWNWRWIFYLDIPLSLFLAFYFRQSLKNFVTLNKETARFDAIGYLSFFLGIFCLGFCLITGQQLDWFRSTLIISMSITGCLFFIYFIFYNLNRPYPIIDLKLFKNPHFSFALLNLAILFSAYFGMIMLLAQWLKLWVNYTPDWIGLLLLIMSISGIFPFFLLFEKVRRIDNRIFLIAGILLLAISCFHTMLFNVEINFGRIAFSRILAGFGMAFFLAPIFRICFHNFPSEKYSHVLTLFQIVRALGSGLGAAAYITIWQRRQVFYHDRLGSNITPFSFQTQQYFSKADQVQLFDGPADAKLEYYLQRQATSLALDDCFWLMGWILIGLLVTFLFTLYANRRAYKMETVS